MQFSDINFTVRSDLYGSRKGLDIRGYWVSKNLVDLMWLRAQQVLPTLDWSKPQTVVSIFGDFEEWKSNSFGARIALGRCLKFYVDHDMLPIQITNKNKKGTRKYGRK